MISRRAQLALVAAGGWLAWRNRPGASLRDRVALVTGGSRGLGFLIARELLDRGARVAICARDLETLDRAANLLAGHGPVAAFRCDVARPEEVSRMIQDVVARFGRLDVLVNNASVIKVAPLETMTRGDFEEALDITFWGTVNTTLEALPHLRRARGRIANITSIGAKVPIPHLLPYDAAKFAAIGFSQGLRTELARSGVTVTTVVPGLMRTGSPVHVRYGGKAPLEYAWFAAGDITPATAMSAERAAAAIVRALRRGDPEIVLTWQAKLLRMIHALAPSTTARVLGVVNRLLPSAPAHVDPTGPADPGRWTRGRDLRGTMPAPLEWALDRSGDGANQ